MSRGAEFGEVAPKNQLGRIRMEFATILSTSFDLDNGVIFPLTPVTGVGPDRANSFRLGQQILFWFTIANPITLIGVDPASANWLTRLRLKLWWLRPDLEYRAPGGAGGFTPLDRVTFGAGPSASFINNRDCWIPSPKRLDTTPYITPPPVAPPAGNSDSILLDDILTWDLQDPNTVAYAASYSADQVIGRRSVIMYPAMGYALGVTADPTYAFAPGGAIALPSVQVACSYAVGTLGGTNYQESVG